MVYYNLSHLTQADDQLVAGPIQDDEALFLYALIRCTRIRRILEVGGLSGYSARNFLAAMGPGGILYTVDLKHVPCLSSSHVTIMSSCEKLNGQHLENQPVDLVFFDCHIYSSQMRLYYNLLAEGIINDKTTLALHDTNLHPLTDEPGAPPRQWGAVVEGGWMHQAVERQMVNTLRNEGYEALMLHTTSDKHDKTLTLRHGLTILTKPKHLDIGEMNVRLEEGTYVGSELNEQHSR